MDSPSPPVLVQGLTGREARFWAERMRACGTNIVAGVTPGKGGERVDGVPVFDTVDEARERTRASLSVLFVPPRAARAASLEAIRRGRGEHNLYRLDCEEALALDFQDARRRVAERRVGVP